MQINCVGCCTYQKVNFIASYFGNVKLFVWEWYINMSKITDNWTGEHSVGIYYLNSKFMDLTCKRGFQSFFWLFTRPLKANTKAYRF